jgi:hypothetical protein
MQHPGVDLRLHRAALTKNLSGFHIKDLKIRSWKDATQTLSFATHLCSGSTPPRANYHLPIFQTGSFRVPATQNSHEYRQFGNTLLCKLTRISIPMTCGIFGERGLQYS